jgi:polar amino acid transport system substrate-binding protein
MKKALFILFAPFLLAANMYAQKQDSQLLKPLIVGTASGYAPYVSLDQNGQYEGFDIDVAELLAQKLGRKLVIKDFGSMPSLLLALKQNKADLLIWAISITEARLKTMEMVYYQGEKTAEMPFLFWNQIPEGIKSIEDLGKDSKKVICVEAGTFQEAVVKQVPNITLKNIDKVSDLIMEIKYGKSAATTIDPALLARFKAQYPEIKVLNLPLSPKDQSLGNGICINKTNQELAAEVRRAIGEIAAEGKIAQLEKKWKMATP